MLQYEFRYDISAKIKHDDLMLSLIDWSDEDGKEYLVSLKPENGFQRYQGRFESFDLAVDKFAEILKILHKNPRAVIE